MYIVHVRGDNDALGCSFSDDRCCNLCCATCTWLQVLCFIEFLLDRANNPTTNSPPHPYLHHDRLIVVLNHVYWSTPASVDDLRHGHTADSVAVVFEGGSTRRGSRSRRVLLFEEMRRFTSRFGADSGGIAVCLVRPAACPPFAPLQRFERFRFIVKCLTPATYLPGGVSRPMVDAQRTNCTTSDQSLPLALPRYLPLERPCRDTEQHRQSLVQLGKPQRSHILSRRTSNLIVLEEHCCCSFTCSPSAAQRRCPTYNE